MRILTFKIYSFCFIIYLISVSGFTNQVNTGMKYDECPESYDFSNEIFFNEFSETGIYQNDNFSNFENFILSNCLTSGNKTSYNRVKTQSVYLLYQTSNSFFILKTSKPHLQKSVFADLQYLKFLRITKMLC